MTKTLIWTPAPAVPRPWRGSLRRATAAVLRSASGVLARTARRLRAQHAPERPLNLPDIEFAPFHSDAGAPEGALYVDGELVAIVPGLKRL
jgi:hypothetical protein